KIGFDKIATGHYARSTTVIPSKSAGRREIPVVKLLEAKDKNKDQTYFLHQLSQAQLQHVLFPLGNHTKPEVRKLAKKFGLSTADKAESMGICFVGEVPMKEFLQKKIKIKKGKVVTGDGQAVREHDGLAFYTIGQRIGIMSSGGPAAPASRVRNDHTQPLYVVDKSFKANELVVGHEDDPLLYKEEIRIGEINWIGGQTPQFPLKCKVRLRHRQELQNCVAQCHYEEAKGRRSNLSLRFTKSQRAVTPGQFAVFYLKGECLGGGVVKS
ncbi:MAG TPA: aminomethyltransferase beta-barrel domain-containing protein, partial [Patescibacteria group bacterium]|nr:aminomethyltransferase beta-barrel domain-containing protein [Patescibacteria group bacterium]